MSIYVKGYDISYFCFGGFTSPFKKVVSVSLLSIRVSCFLGDPDMADKIMLIVRRYSLLSKSVEMRRERWIKIHEQRLLFFKIVTHFRHSLSSTQRRVESEVCQCQVQMSWSIF